MLPRDRIGKIEPLIVTGRPEQGDFVIVEYMDASTVRFALDHWGGTMVRSDPVPWDFSRPHELEIAMESLNPPVTLERVLRGGFEIRIDGHRAWQTATETFRVEPEEMIVGRNVIGGTSCDAKFSGQVLAAERERP
jgi:hypothetical protein